MMSRGPDNFTEEELLWISRPVDPSTLLIGSKGRESDWIKSACHIACHIVRTGMCRVEHFNHEVCTSG